jgi:hypothetical protein
MHREAVKDPYPVLFREHRSKLSKLPHSRLRQDRIDSRSLTMPMHPACISPTVVFALLALLPTVAISCQNHDSGTTHDTGGSSDSDSERADSQDSEDTHDTDTGIAIVPWEPGAAFDAYCQGRHKNGTLVPTIVGELSGKRASAYTTLSKGDMETMGFVPEAPFWVETLRVWFEGTGTAHLRLMTDYGRSYPDIDALENDSPDVMPPLDFEVTDENEGDWIDIDVSGYNVNLLPTQHYFLVYEHSDPQPFLVQETIPSGDHYRSALLYDGSWYGVGDDTQWYNYRMELQGQSFCDWTSDEKSFVEQEGPWADLGSQRATITDANGDFADDIVLNNGSPRLYLGDGAGGFSEPDFDPWPEASSVGVMIFADLDNDGDNDAVGLRYLNLDADGDGYQSGLEGPDCNDADATVYPGATETTNGRDDDCDGIADDGTDTVDDDGDGFSESTGDCDDTQATTFPGAPEIANNRDDDCDLVTDETSINQVFLNSGSGTFTAISSLDLEATDPSAAGAMADADADGALDLYYGNWLVHYPDPPAVMDRYFTGDGDGSFTDAAAASGINEETEQGGLACYGVVWADYNNDNAADIFVSNYGYGHNLLYENQGDGTFLEVGEAHGVSHDPTLAAPGTGILGGNTFGADWGDVDNDGDLDLFATDIAHPRYQPWSDKSRFLENGGPPDFLFTDIRKEAGIHYDEGDVNVSFADYDNDGDLDMLVTSLYTGHYATLYRNDGYRHFTDVTFESGIRVHDSVSNVWTDIDQDGDLDVVVADREGPDYVHLFRNAQVNANHWLELWLVGTTSNRSAIGARVKLQSDAKTQIREVKAGGGHAGNQSSLQVHFGLGTSTAPLSLEVTWPSGLVEAITGAAADGRYLVTEGEGVAEALD